MMQKIQHIMKKKIILLIFISSLFTLNAQITGYKITMLLTDSNKITIYAKPVGTDKVKWLQNSVTLAFPSTSPWYNIDVNDYSIEFNKTLFGKPMQTAIVHKDKTYNPLDYSYITFWGSADPACVETQLTNGQKYNVCTITTKRKISVPIRLVNINNFGGDALDGITVIGDNTQQHFVSDGTNETIFYSSKDETNTIDQTGYSGTWSITGTETDHSWVEVTPPTSDIKVTIKADNLTPEINKLVVFTITTSNLGTYQATNVSTDFKLPAEFEFVNYTTSTSPATTYNPSTGVWSIGTLDNNGVVTLTVTGKVKDVKNITPTTTTKSDIYDPDLTNNTSTVNINVKNDNPTANADGLTTTLNEPANGSITASDPNGDKLTYTVTTSPTHGTVVINPQTGAYTYTPATDYTGPDKFTVTVTDGYGGTTSIDIPVTILASPYFKKYSLAPIFKNDGTYDLTYIIVIKNRFSDKITNVQVEDNLDNVFAGTGCSYTVKNITASGQLTANNLYDGSFNIKTLIDNQSMTANSKDSITIHINVDTKGQATVIHVQNKATLTCSIDGFSYKDDFFTPELEIPVVTFYLPEGFTPNGDGINDYFKITHSEDLKVEIQIFNRWGNVVYESKEYNNNWNGSGNGNFIGKEISTGTYYCAYKAIHKATGKIMVNGLRYITLLRN